MTGAELKRRRVRAGMTYRALALAIGTTERSVYRWEASLHPISAATKQAILNVLAPGSKTVAEPSGETA